MRSSLQKIRLQSGRFLGVYVDNKGAIRSKDYEDFLREIIDNEDLELLKNFILTIGVVSNHGNWFTSDNHNKELKVLAQSYDWLLFLTDKGLGDFIRILLLKPPKKYKPVRKAFLESYKGRSGANKFTKVKMDFTADKLLTQYFAKNLSQIQSWFNVIAPSSGDLQLLRDELNKLSNKKWLEIHS